MITNDAVGNAGTPTDEKCCAISHQLLITAKTKLYEMYVLSREHTKCGASWKQKFEIQITQNAPLTESKFEIQIKIESKLKTRSLGNLSNQLFVHQHNKRISILTTVVRTPHSIMEHKTTPSKNLNECS